MEANFVHEKNAISSVYPWLLAAHINNANLVDYRWIVADTQEFAWKDSVDADVTFTPFPFTIPSIEMNTSSAFPAVSIRAFNTATVVKLVEENNGFIGSDVTIYFLNANAVVDGVGAFVYNMSTYPLQFDFQINNVKIGKYIIFELGGPNYLTHLLPSKRYYRDFCDVEYQKDFCWMKDYSVVSEEDQCNKSWDNCLAHWEDQSKPTKGLRFGGFPNLEKGNIIYY